MDEIYKLDDLPLHYVLKRNRLPLDTVERECKVRFKATWQHKNGDTANMFGWSPAVKVNRLISVPCDCEPFKAIRTMFKDEDFMKLVREAATAVPWGSLINRGEREAVS